ncbi:S8 family serine peptidase [Noviherbaspirillum galbum]|uniref:S8 family serine peptidase n=1 Tax=Noviherbaspirillum galbum TaxID=2709383 RepID=A0A6B3SNW8_9BURK|nr:S8 family serine peptidase [Noviherbaspirillum galbum]NEX62504.1 S8 family serine peptidase [Noviherbaspirillum galbum]
MAKPTEQGNNPQDAQTSNGDGATPPGAKPGARPAGAASVPSTDAPAGRKVGQRKSQYLVAARQNPALQMMGLQPLSFDVIEQALRGSPDIEVIDTVGPKNVVGALADGLGGNTSVLVARMTDQKAFMLHQQAQGRLVVERDQPLAILDPAFQPPLVSGATSMSGPVLNAAIVVLGRDNAPLKGAEVYLFGSMLPATAVTDERGQATLTLYGETVQSLRGLYVKPKSDYWSFYQQNPDISIDEPNVVGLRPLSDWPSLASFPRQQAYGWGQRAMRLDQLPGQYRGQGVKVAIIDSGAAALTHDDLKQIRAGFDIVDKKTNPDGWTTDIIAHGSHCAGIICGADNALGVRGFAPDAEVHACKLFPGGQTSQLIDALEYCIEKQIDVVNLSLGGAEPSEALEQQILRCKRAGIACIVAAGNSGGPVQYPASSPNVLAVSAIGRLNEFPSDSYHSQTVTSYVDADGYFAARFSCFGPEVAVCAPGVAITSSVPDNNYAEWDGTSMAAPHVTGLAALVMAHHPDFQGAYKNRGPERVERLFQLIKMSCRPLTLGDARRTGYGLPDVLAAVGLQAQAGAVANAASGFKTAHAVPMMELSLAPQAWFGALAGQGTMARGMLGGLDPAYVLYMQSVMARPQFYGMT